MGVVGGKEKKKEEAAEKLEAEEEEEVFLTCHNTQQNYSFELFPKH